MIKDQHLYEWINQLKVFKIVSERCNNSNTLTPEVEQPYVNNECKSVIKYD